MPTKFERYRGSSKYFLALSFPIVLIYMIGHLLRLFKTDGEKKKVANIHSML